VAAAVLGLFAVQNHQFLLGRLAPHLSLKLSDYAIHGCNIDRLEQTRKGGTTGRGIPTAGVWPNPQRPALSLRELLGETR
jgi:hypothetical protein